MTMRSTKPIAFVFVLTFLVFLSANADTYVKFDLGTDNTGHGGVGGLDDAGDVAIAAPCPILESGPCYTIFQPFGPTRQSVGLPNLDFDDGTPCSTISGALFEKCNNGHEAYMLDFPSFNPNLKGMFLGPNLNTDKVSGTAYAQIILVNANGDIAWTDSLLEENFELYDLTTRQTPEPGAFLLVATGALGFVSFWRRG